MNNAWKKSHNSLPSKHCIGSESFFKKKPLFTTMLTNLLKCWTGGWQANNRGGWIRKKNKPQFNTMQTIDGGWIILEKKPLFTTYALINDQHYIYIYIYQISVLDIQSPTYSGQDVFIGTLWPNVWRCEFLGVPYVEKDLADQAPGIHWTINMNGSWWIERASTWFNH